MEATFHHFSTAELLKKSDNENTRLLTELGSALSYHALQAPIDGLGQLLRKIPGCPNLPELKICAEPEEAVFASKNWQAQQIGSALGTTLPFLLIKNTLRHAGISELMQTHYLKPGTRDLIEASTAAAILGTVFRKGADDDAHFWESRLKNGSVDALSFSTFCTSNRVLGSLSRKLPTENGIAMRLANAVISGGTAGAVAAESAALLSEGKLARYEELAKSVYSFAFIGGTLTAVDAGFQPRNIAGRSLAFSDKFLSEKLRTEENKQLFRAFEERAIALRISHANQIETIEQVSKLVKPRKKDSAVDRQLHPQLAKEVLQNIAQPFYIDQGNHPTCVLNSIENIVASGHPEKYSQIIADIAIKGGSTHGITLPENCLEPDREARITSDRDGRRVFASQLFQYYLANIHWSEGGDLPDGSFSDTVTYQPVKAGSNSAGLFVDGELLKDYGRNSKGNFVKITYEAPEIEEWHIVPLFRKVVPRGKLTVIDHIDSVDSGNFNGRKTVNTVKSVKDLEYILSKNSPNAMICGVRAEGLLGQTKSSQEFGWHSVVVRDYDPRSRSLYLDNSWGRAEEWSGRNFEKPRMSIEHLFEIMTPKDAEKAA